MFWLVINILSTFISIYSIRELILITKILRITKDLANAANMSDPARTRLLALIADHEESFRISMNSYEVM